MIEAELRAKIAELVGLYADQKYREKVFYPGQDIIPPSGKVIGKDELQHMVEASLDGWLTTGRFNDQFEKKLKSFLGVDYVLTTTSGSSANLLALTALTSPKLKDRRLRPDDEVITVAAGFPTTVNPILQNGLVPVFVDIEIPTYNVSTAMIEAALSSKTRAIMLAHTLGNPFDIDAVRKIAEKHNLWLIEDCCDALGSLYKGRQVGTFGDIATLSFYPAHHITMGEGGAVITRDQKLKTIIESFRDWGRDCNCEPGCDNTCGKRFVQQFGTLPFGYDHKYTYSHLGYNLKITDMQAACGVAQLDKLRKFIKIRNDNFAYLKKGLQELGQFIELPQATVHSVPSWFGFPVTLKKNSGVNRSQLIKFLDDAKIGTRLLFAGNLIHQPYFENLKYRVVGDLANTNRVMCHTFWLGIFPGLNHDHLNYIIQKFKDFFSKDLV